MMRTFLSVLSATSPGFRRRECPGTGLMARVLLLAWVLMAQASCAGAPEGVRQSGDELEVITMAERFMEALSSGDTATLSQLMLEEATLHSVRAGEGGPETRVSTRGEFLGSLGRDERVLLERIWNPGAFVEGSVAVVWASYDFFVDGRFSHCGTDVLTYIRGAEGWKIAGVTYDVIREGCAPSPLGPPGGSPDPGVKP